jgi:hypothetical protein
MKIKRSELKSIIKEVLGERKIKNESIKGITPGFVNEMIIDMYTTASSMDTKEAANFGKTLGKGISEHIRDFEEGDAFKRALKGSIR